MIPIKNLYFILCYSWGRLDEGALVDVSVDEIKAPQDLLARVLINGTNRLLKEGLYRGYIEELEETASLRGKIDFSTSIRKMLFHQGKAAVLVDDLSHNILHNQILKTTIATLLKNVEIDRKLHSELQVIERNLRSVDLINLNSATFKRVQLHQNNSFYSFLMNVCELICHNSQPDSEGGEVKFRDFTRDEVKMRKVFQDFVLNFYKLNQSKYSVDPERLHWDSVDTDADSWMFPFMYTDVTLSSYDRKIVLDTKYYQEAFQNNWGKQTIRSEHLYQLNTYLDYTKKPLDPNAKLDGILLYPATNEEFTLKKHTRGHQIIVAAVDLRKDWKAISNRLLELIN